MTEHNWVEQIWHNDDTYRKATHQEYICINCNLGKDIIGLNIHYYHINFPEFYIGIEEPSCQECLMRIVLE